MRFTRSGLKRMRLSSKNPLNMLRVQLKEGTGNLVPSFAYTIPEKDHDNSIGASREGIAN